MLSDTTGLQYVDRRWLNPDTSSSTGACVAYYGKANYDREGRDTAFFEISDCHSKVRLHKSDHDRYCDFARKLRELAQAADQFAHFIEQNLSEDR